MSVVVGFDPKEQRHLDSGKWVFIGVVIYIPGTDSLGLLVTNERPSEESAAIVAKFIGENIKMKDITHL